MNCCLALQKKLNLKQTLQSEVVICVCISLCTCMQYTYGMQTLQMY